MRGPRVGHHAGVAFPEPLLPLAALIATFLGSAASRPSRNKRHLPTYIPLPPLPNFPSLQRPLLACSDPFQLISRSQETSAAEAAAPSLSCYIVSNVYLPHRLNRLPCVGARLSERPVMPLSQARVVHVNSC